MINKLVSICIPTYNSATFITEAITSITQQTYSNIEIIVGDNASTDNTEEIVDLLIKKDARIKYYRNTTNLGYSGNCNKLISLASGDYVAIYHSDDIYDPSIVEKEVEILDNNADILGVFTLAKQIDTSGARLADMFSPFRNENGVRRVSLDQYINNVIDYGGSCFVCPTSMIRKSIYETLDGYNTELKYIEDQDMWARILQKGLIAVIPEYLISYRVHPLQASSYYTNLTRNTLSISITHIEAVINNLKIEKQFATKLTKAKVRDYYRMIKNGIIIDDYNLVAENIKRLRTLKIKRFWSSKSIIQKTPIIITYYYMRSMLILKRK